MEYKILTWNRKVEKGIWKKLSRILMVMGVWGILLADSTFYSQAEEYEYDTLNRVTKVTYEDGSYVEYEYDSNGNILNIKVHNEKADHKEEQGSEEIPPESDEESTDSDKEESTEGDDETGETEESGSSGTQEDKDTEESQEESFMEKVVDTVKTVVQKVVNWFRSLFS